MLKHSLCILSSIAYTVQRLVIRAFVIVSILSLLADALVRVGISRCSAALKSSSSSPEGAVLQLLPEGRMWSGRQAGGGAAFVGLPASVVKAAKRQAQSQAQAQCQAMPKQRAQRALLRASYQDLERDIASGAASGAALGQWCGTIPSIQRCTTAICCDRRCGREAVDLCAGCAIPRCELHISRCSLCHRGLFCHDCVSPHRCPFHV